MRGLKPAYKDKEGKLGGEEVETLLITPWMWKEVVTWWSEREKTLSRKEETPGLP